MPPNDGLRTVIQETGLSYAALARRIQTVARENGDDVRTNSSAVSHWVAGKPPKSTTCVYIAEALSRALGRLVTPSELGLPSSEGDTARSVFAGEPVSALANLGRADVDRRSFLGSMAYSIGALTLPLELHEVITRGTATHGGAVGQTEIDTVREVTEVFTRADERLGGDTSRSAVVEYLVSDVADYCNGAFRSDKSRSEMFGAAAELAYLAGWKAHDAGKAGLAQRYYLHAFRLADESDPHAHAGYVLRILAHQAFDNGHNEHCADIADAALSRVRGHVNTETESLFWLTAGRAHAANRDGKAALSAIGTAEKLLSTSVKDKPPRWASLGGPPEARLTNQAAKALSAMGDLAGAEEQFRQSAQFWNPKTHPRIHALTLSDQAEMQLKRGHLEAACETWSSALKGLAGVNSARARNAVSDMRVQLRTYRHRGSSVAQALDVEARKWQSENVPSKQLV